MKKHQTNENWIFTTLLALTATSGIFLSLPSASADVVDTVTITVPKACSMSSTISSTHSAEINNGQYQDDIGETVIKATCNDAEGFSIYAIGFTDDEYGKNVLSSSLGAANDIVTGTADSGSISNWAMKLSPVDGAYAPSILSDSDGSYSDYHIIPDTYAKVATRTSGTDLVVGASLKTTYATYVSGTQSAGTYEGKVKYTLVHPASRQAPYTPVVIPCEPGKICYYPNANDHEGTMGDQTTDDNNASLADNATVTLLASNFSREGYGFAGWNDSPFYTGNFYGPNETISAPTGTSEEGLSLYAVWVESEGNLQDSETVASVCGRLTTAPIDGTANLESVSALTDKRDNETYAIAKLADGNCWMIENLRLEAEYTRGSYYESLAQGYETGFTGLADSETISNFKDITTSNSLYTTEENVEGKNSILGIGQSSRFPRYNNLNTQSRATNPAKNNAGRDSDGGIYGYGNYYTWPASIASTSGNTGGSFNDASTSICPKGWRLPTGNENGDFYNLNLSTNSGSTSSSSYLRIFPTNLVYSGYVSDGYFYNRGYYGSYWSSTSNGNNYTYYLSLHRDYNYPGTGFGARYLGQSIRCIPSN